MVTAIRKEQVQPEKNAAFLTSRPEVDFLERESFFITLKDATKREWLVRLKYFQEVDTSSLRLTRFEYPAAFLGFGEVETQDLVPLEIDMLTEEVVFKDIVGYEYVIEFRDIIDVELL
ncbi:hypothetical protein HCB45_05780 [Listeria sp. FSL L7-0091]|uniref:Uncharacterized protein n=1 Tax=Listeria farberi TaxID=2713500 RepID=A0A7X0ZID2_9LIST|nr:hypothetical protein [Listeria farberi]MBC1375825.1 hypothetical protein [Listeria farberi]MBC1382156.1 hypothetical protein [Listeria farberi]MBC2261103.1 hypothetical protein [Listeria farberi]MBC2268102.1 hypothetical protein [Listeria farberi]MBC2287865.1 hypothetical protein [Listeria farberi]